MFDLLGRWVARRSTLMILAWLAALAVGVGYMVRVGEAEPAALGSFLPDEARHNRALQLLRDVFPDLAARSVIAIIVHRPEGLTPEDFRFLGDIAQRGGELTAPASQPAGQASRGPNALWPDMPLLGPFIRHRLVSANNQAAIALVNQQANFITAGSIREVEAIERLIEAGKPRGLQVEITGSGGIGRDYFHATRAALDNTTYVTIGAVLAILILVYRSPIGALVPLVAIGVSVYLAMVLLAVLGRFGVTISNIERIFTVVLLFGAGVDFALFWISRYRELLGQGLDHDEAARDAMRLTGPAIFTSGATTICGLSTLMATRLIPTQLAGKVLGIVLAVALLAALTLTPAIARRLGRWLFWPGSPAAGPTLGERLIWPRLAGAVTRFPLAILTVGLIGLGAPAVAAFIIPPRFDSLAQLPEGSSSERGYAIVNAEFPPGLLYSNHLLVPLPADAADPAALSEAMTKAIAAVPGVYDVYGLTSPLGRKRSGLRGTAAPQTQTMPDVPPERGATSRAGGLLGGVLDQLGDVVRDVAGGMYLRGAPGVLRFEVLVDHQPFSPEAMTVIDAVEAAANGVVERHAELGGAEVMISGLTPYIMDVRDAASGDQARVMVLGTLVIGAIVWLLIRDLGLTGFMMLATWLTYGAALTATHLFFVQVMGFEGIDYKVRLILFVIVVAVGQDYNIFLVTRLQQEPSDAGVTEAVRRSVVATGSVISSCGLIMAATLGSLCAGGLALLQQAGFALALGILVDTFFVRPLLVPSFYLLRARRGRRAYSKASRVSPAPL